MEVQTPVCLPGGLYSPRLRMRCYGLVPSGESLHSYRASGGHQQSLASGLLPIPHSTLSLPCLTFTSSQNLCELCSVLLGPGGVWDSPIIQ